MLDSKILDVLSSGRRRRQSTKGKEGQRAGSGGAKEGRRRRDGLEFSPEDYEIVDVIVWRDELVLRLSVLGTTRVD